MASMPIASSVFDVTAGCNEGSNQSNSLSNDITASSWRTTSHFLLESDSMADLQMPVGASSRIKYCSIDVSFRYIALGTNTGAIHVFNREPLQYRLPACSDVKDGCITQVAFHPVHDDVLAFATTMGTVCIMQLNIERNERPEILRTILEHKGSVVTALSWSSDGKNLFVGDDQGLINRFFIAATKNKPLFGPLVEFLFKLDSAVVQIDTFDSMVLVTCLTSTHIAYTSRKKCKKIGTKPRHGEYGSCFFPDPDATSKSGKIYCARPGCRLWEVDFSGDVVRTLQLKVLLDDRPPTSIVTLSNAKESFRFEPSCDIKSSFSFPKLHFFGGKFLLTYCDQGLFVTSPSDVRVVLWTTSVRGIMQLSCYRNHAYVLFVDGTVRKFSLLSSTKLWQIFYAKRQWLRCAWLSQNVATCRTTRTAMNGLATHLREEGSPDLADTVAALAMKVPDGLADPDASVDDSTTDCRLTQPPPRSSFRKLQSGIYCRVDEQLSDGEVECRVFDKNLKSATSTLSKTSGQTAENTTVTDVDADELLSRKTQSLQVVDDVLSSNGFIEHSCCKLSDCQCTGVNVLSSDSCPCPCPNGADPPVLRQSGYTNGVITDVIDSVA